MNNSGVVLVTTMIGALLLMQEGCGDDEASNVPLDVKMRYPAVQAVLPELTGSVGPEETARAAVFAAVDEARDALGALELLDAFLEEGGERTRDLTIFLALEGAPRIADGVDRYSRAHSRLDVERVSDHALFYLQFDRGQGYDPDEAITEQYMLVEGSTATPQVMGQRAAIADATGLATPDRGYLRVHLNHRAEDQSATHSGLQLDYRLNQTVDTEDEQAPPLTYDSLHLLYFVRPDAAGEAVTRALWQLRYSDGTGFVYVLSHEKELRLLAQYEADGSMAVWHGDGTLWGCSEGSGVELGSADAPDGCAAFDRSFPQTPSINGLWPKRPGGVP